MLLTLILCIYISFLCWSWGEAIISGLNKLAGCEEASFHFSITCLAGLAGITITGSIISLFAPLGRWYIQLILLIPALIFLLTNYSKKIETLKNTFRGFHFSAGILLLASLLMVLIISSGQMVHPDTLGYHAQTIRWIEEYKAVPGLVHLHQRYGYQGLWFVSCAIFGFRYLGTDAVVFINVAVVSWFFIFIIDKINRSLAPEIQLKQTVLWAGLFIHCIWSYTQVRLTAASASPDFIAALLVWAVMYLLVRKNFRNDADWLLILLLSFFAITVKLSVVPLLLIAIAAFFYFLKRKNYNPIIITMALFIVSVAPYIARNIITSGYIVFPSPFPDIVNADWKYDPASTVLEKNYISAYARIPVEHTERDINEVLEMSLFEWLPHWWKNKTIADKAILLLMLFSLPAGLFNMKKILREGSPFALACFVSLAGTIFWFLQAPDPRFGFGFIIALTILSLYHFLPAKNMIRPARKLIVALVLLLSLSVSAYSVYRLIYFFSATQLISPVGIVQTPFTTVECNGVRYIIPAHEKDCGNLPLPCIYKNCENIIPRGDKLSDGFKAK